MFKEQIVYIIFGHEVGSKKNTPHLQGYIQFKNALVFDNVKSKLHKRVRIAHAGGSYDQNKKYCSKEGDWYEWGKPKRNQGKRNDIVKLNELMEDGNGIGDILRSGAIKRANHLSYVERCMKYLEPTRKLQKPKIFWCYGGTGVGKSHWAWEYAGANFSSIYTGTTFSNGKTWFNGYDAHECIIINEVRGDSMPWEFLLNFTDKYPMSLETKGGTRQLHAKCIIFTTPKHPKKTFQYHMSEDLTQITRRMKILEFTKGALGFSHTEVV